MVGIRRQSPCPLTEKDSREPSRPSATERCRYDLRDRWSSLISIQPINKSPLACQPLNSTNSVQNAAHCPYCPSSCICCFVAEHECASCVQVQCEAVCSIRVAAEADVVNVVQISGAHASARSLVRDRQVIDDPQPPPSDASPNQDSTPRQCKRALSVSADTLPHVYQFRCAPFKLNSQSIMSTTCQHAWSSIFHQQPSK